MCLTLSAPIPQNGETHSNSLSATADELFECVYHFVNLALITSVSKDNDKQDLLKTED